MKKPKEKNEITLPMIRVGSLTETIMQQALKSINEKNFNQMSMQEFRRISYFYFAQKILELKGEINKFLQSK